MAKNEMAGKALVFVTGHNRPAVAPLTAKYVRRFPDGSPMLAESTSDTIAAAEARHAAQVAEQAKAAARKKEAKADGA